MPLVKDINVHIDQGATTASVTFTQLFEGAWELGMLDFVRLAGTRTWKPVHNEDILWEVKTEITRYINKHHAGGVGPVRSLKLHREPKPRVTVKSDPLADKRLSELPLSQYRAVVRGATRKTLTPTQAPVMPVETPCESPTCKRRAFEGAHRKTNLCADAQPVTPVEAPVAAVVTVTTGPQCESARCRRRRYLGAHELSGMCSDD